MNKIDLQIQSTASDGAHNPREIVGMARERGVQVIALTDHDTIAGIPEALMAAGEIGGLRVIPGIELSVAEHRAHILGFGIDYRSERLLSELQLFRERRESAARKMAENLQQAGFVLEWEDVLVQAKGDIVARPHLARAVLAREENIEKLGGISTVHEFIQGYLKEENSNYVGREHMSAKDAIALLHTAKGIAVWAHPALSFPEDYDGLEDFLKLMLEWGLDGIESLNPAHTEDDVEFLQGMVAQYKLLWTAGSDFHEASKPTSEDTEKHAHGGGRAIGDYQTYGFVTDEVVAKLDEAMGKYRNGGSGFLPPLIKGD